MYVRVRWTLSLLKIFVPCAYFSYLFIWLVVCFPLCTFQKFLGKKTAEFCNLIYQCFHLLIWKEVGETNGFGVCVKWRQNTEHCTGIQKFFTQLINRTEREINAT